MTALLIIAAHLCGDFLLQNHWMQRKASSSLVCAVHVACYSVPFTALMYAGVLPWWMHAAIMVQHFLQDRFQLHLKWMRWYGHTTPSMWPAGPLCIDQAMHLTFIGALGAVFQILNHTS